MHDPGVLIDPPRNRLVRIYVWRACLDSTCKLQDTRLELHRGKGHSPCKLESFRPKHGRDPEAKAVRGCDELTTLITAMQVLRWSRAARRHCKR
jgi:hypothetical protein